MSFIVLSFHRPEHGLDQIYRDTPSRCSPFSSRLTKSVLNIVYELQITMNTNNQVLEVLAHMVFFSAGAWVLICGFGWHAFCFSSYTSLCMIQRVSLLKKAKAKVIKRSLFLTSFFSLLLSWSYEWQAYEPHICFHSLTNLFFKISP